MKNKKNLLYLIIGIIFIIVAIVSSFDTENTSNNSVHSIPANVIATDIGEIPENFSLEENSNLQLFFFDVGQADSILAVNKGITMLIDAGNKEDGKLLTEYIEQLGIRKIDYLIGTHAHEDHIGGISDVINNFEIGIFYMPVASKARTKTYLDMVETANNRNISVINPVIETAFEIGNAECVIKYIDNTEPSNPNNASIILQLTSEKMDYLFMGDAEAVVENLGNWTDIEVLKVGHHGSSTSSTQDFLNKTLPEISIISVGKNDFGHPNGAVIKRLQVICEDVYRTDENGTIYLENVDHTNKVTVLKTNLDGN